MDTQRPGASTKVFLFLALAGLVTTGGNWYLWSSQDRYYVKLAVLGPIALVMGAFFLVFPRFAGKTNGDRSKAAGQVAAVIAACGLGAANWWLHSHA
jgi:hypothetical protein